MNYANVGQIPAMNIQGMTAFLRSAPKTIKDWLGRKISLADPVECKEKFGVIPGTILIPTQSQNPQDQLEVMGLGASDGHLWVRRKTGLRKSFPVEFKNKTDLIRAGFQWAVMTQIMPTASQINDTAEAIETVRNMLRNQIGCDIFFQVGEKKIGGHIAILKQKSHYFRSIVDGDFKESHEKIVKIDDLEAEEFEMLLEYLYTGMIVIDEENILMVAGLANRFGVDKLKEHCGQRMKELLQPHQALIYFHEVCGTDVFLVPIIQDYVVAHLMQICHQGQEVILDLPKETLSHLIRIVPNDKKDEMFLMTMLWLHHPDENQRGERFNCFVAELFPLLPKEDVHLSRYAWSLRPYIDQSSVGHGTLLQLFTSAHQNVWMLALLGEALRLNNQTSQAQEKFWAALKLNENLSFALSRFAEITRQHGLLNEAQKLFKKALSLESSSFGLGHYALTLQALGNGFEARQKFEQAIVAYDNEKEHIDEFVFSKYKELITGSTTVVQVGEARVRASSV